MVSGKLQVSALYVMRLRCVCVLIFIIVFFDKWFFYHSHVCDISGVFELPVEFKLDGCT